MTFKRVFVAAILAGFLPLQAGAGLLDDDEARKAILALSARVDGKLRDIDALLRDMNARIDTKGDKAIGLDMVNQHEQTMRELANLRGQVEVLAHEISAARKNQNALYVDLEARIKRLELPQESGGSRLAEAQSSEKTSYESVMNAFKAGDYKDAAAGLQAFLRLFPDSAYAADAQYWLGNAYFAQGDYRNAIAAHETVLARYRDSANVPDALLNIAASFSQVNDKKNARKSMQQLISAYAGSDAAKLARLRLAKLK